MLGYMNNLHRRGQDFSGARLAIYVRASDDSEETENSVNAQRRRGEQWAESVGITDVKVYCDNDLSASLYATKDREDFDRLCSDVESGDRTLIWFWTSSRQTRRLDVYVPFRDLCRRKDVAWVIKRRVYDLNDPSDLRALGNDAVNNEVFSLELSENLKLAHELRASMGRPAGQTTYGYIRQYDHRRRFAGQEPDERLVPLLDENGNPRTDAEGSALTTTRAAVVRGIFEQCARRVELLNIARALDERGVPTPRGGKHWRTSVVRRIALNYAYIGVMVHNGEVIERPGPCWTPLLQLPDGRPDEETFYAARSYLLDPSRKTTRATHSVHLLTNIPDCDVCDGPMIGVRIKDYRWSPQNERTVYRCHTSAAHVSISKEPLDEFVSQAVDGYLARPDVYADLMSTADTGAEQSHIQAELQRLRTDLEEWQSLAEKGEVTPGSFARAEKGLLAKIKEHEGKLEALSAPPLLKGRIGPDRTETFFDLDFQTQRKVIRYCVDLKIKRVGSGRSGVPVAERIIWRWKTGPGASDGQPVEFPSQPSDFDVLNESAVEMFAEMLSAGRLPGVQKIRNAMHVGQRRAQAIQRHLQAHAPSATRAASKYGTGLSASA